jgi:hypothetical protein
MSHKQRRSVSLTHTPYKINPTYSSQFNITSRSCSTVDFEWDKHYDLTQLYPDDNDDSIHSSDDLNGSNMHKFLEFEMHTVSNSLTSLKSENLNESHNLRNNFNKPLKIMTDSLTRNLNDANNSFWSFSQLRCFMCDIGKRVKHLVLTTFNIVEKPDRSDACLSAIDENTVETYDIIEMNDKNLQVNK